MKTNNHVLFALGFFLVAPLSINAHKPKMVDYCERVALQVPRLHEEKINQPAPISAPMCPLPWIWKKASKIYGMHYLVSFYLALAHEYGHKIAAKLLYGVDSTIRLIPTWAGVEGYARYHKPIPGTGLKTSLVCIAGPACGAALGYGILKAYNILSEHYDHGKDIKNALKDGIKKPILNADQSFALQGAVLLNTSFNLLNLIPLTCPDGQKTDGALLIDSLKNL